MIKTAFDWSQQNPEIMVIAGVVFLILLGLYEVYEGKKSIGKAAFNAFVLVVFGIMIAYLFAM